MKTNSLRGLLAASLCAILTFAAITSEAGHLSSIPSISITTDSGDSWGRTAAQLHAHVIASPAKGYELDSELHFNGIWGGNADVVIKSLEFDPDPFVLNNILITNNTNIAQNYTVLVTLPTQFGAPNTIKGAINTSVIDGGGAAGATLTTIGADPIYQARIDGATVQAMQSSPFTLTAPAAGTGTASEAFGPMPNLMAVTNDISILLRFRLSSRDTAAIVSRFDVVPEPASGVLLLVSLVGVVFCRRR